MIHSLLVLFAILFCFPLPFTAAVSPLQTIQAEEKSAQTLVIFGATGDLTKRKLVPALLALEKKNQLPEAFSCIGVGRREMTNEQFRDHVAEFIAEKDQAAWQKFKNKISYLKGSFDEESSYQTLADKVDRIQGDRLFYLATPAAQFSPIIEKLSTHELLSQNARVIIEKPFGRDLATAIQLQDEISQYLQEEQIYRIDHFLGKAGIAELLKFRFDDPIVEEHWNNRQIESVSITISEDLGVETRGSFWEQTGLLRDLVQNHAMQILTLAAMEKPSSFSPREIQQEKVRLVESIRIDQALRGQYGKGNVGGIEVPAYREEPGVSESSSVETYVETTLFVDNPRWEGVPFTIKAGKRLQEKFTEVAVQFKSDSELASFGQLIIRVQPIEEIYFEKGENRIVLQKGNGAAPEAYEKLLFEAMKGDASHFVSVEELMGSWRLFTPILAEWEKNPATDFPNYSAGSAGPTR